MKITDFKEVYKDFSIQDLQNEATELTIEKNKMIAFGSIMDVESLILIEEKLKYIHQCLRERNGKVY